MQSSKLVLNVLGLTVSMMTASPAMADRVEVRSRGRGGIKVDVRIGVRTPAPRVRVRERIIIERGRPVYRSPRTVVIRTPMVRIRRSPVIVDLRFRYRDRILSGRIVPLGSTSLSHNTDYDVIPVHQCGVKKLQFLVTGNDASIDHIIAEYENGTSQELDIREYYEAGSVSTWKDVPGYSQCVRNIVVIGETSAPRARGQAMVEVFGLK